MLFNRSNPKVSDSDFVPDCLKTFSVCLLQFFCTFKHFTCLQAASRMLTFTFKFKLAWWELRLQIVQHTKKTKNNNNNKLFYRSWTEIIVSRGYFKFSQIIWLFHWWIFDCFWSLSLRRTWMWSQWPPLETVFQHLWRGETWFWRAVRTCLCWQNRLYLTRCQDVFVALKRDNFIETLGHFQPCFWKQTRLFWRAVGTCAAAFVPTISESFWEDIQTISSYLIKQNQVF